MHLPKRRPAHCLEAFVPSDASCIDFMLFVWNAFVGEYVAGKHLPGADWWVYEQDNVVSTSRLVRNRPWKNMLCEEPQGLSYGQTPPLRVMGVG